MARELADTQTASYARFIDAFQSWGEGQRWGSDQKSLNSLRLCCCSLLILSLCACSGSPGSQSVETSGSSQQNAPSSLETAPVLQSPPLSTPAGLAHENTSTTEGGVVPVAAKNPDQQVQPAVEAGSPEALLAEISRLRTAPVNVVLTPVPGQPGQFQETSLNPDQQSIERVRRLHRVIELSHQVIAKTHANPEQEQFFNNAVSVLTDARMQLMMAGDSEQGDLLARDAEDLFKRDPTSFAAIDAGARTVQLAQSLSQLNTGNKELAIAFSRRARLFAERFPQETSRGAVAVAMAARQCDQLGLEEEARLGYTVLLNKFAGTPFAEQAAGPIRRYAAVGKPLSEFEGESHEGGIVSIDQYRGKYVLIAFWSSASVFPDHIPNLERIEKSSSGRLTVLGVCLDQDFNGLEAVLEKCTLGWKHIFYAAPELRGLANPVAQYYGVTKVPSYWLVDPQGVLKSITVDATRLEDVLSQLK